MKVVKRMIIGFCIPLIPMLASFAPARVHVAGTHIPPMRAFDAQDTGPVCEATIVRHCA